MAHRPVIASLLGLAVLASACSGPSEEVGGNVEDQVTSTTVPSELAFVDETEDDAALRLALSRPESWDPIEVNIADQGAVLVSDLLYDGLTEASAAGVLRPALATDWTASSDFRSWTFTLDRERTSQSEVIASFARLRSEGAASAAAVLLGDVESIDPTGDDGVAFTLRNGNAGFAWLLSGLLFSIHGEEPTGLYRVARDSEEVTLFSSESGRDIEVTWAVDGNASYQLLTLGQVDAAMVDPSQARDAANRFGQQPSARSISRFYAMNLGSEDLWDPRVRQAVMLSIDRPAILEKLAIAAFTADGVAAPSVAGFRYGACSSACVFNPGEARDLLRSADSYPTLTVVFVDDSQRGVATEIAKGLENVGLGAEVVQISAAELPGMIADGRAEVFAFGWAAPADSLDAVVAPMFASYSSLNVSRLVSPEVDDLLLAASLTADDNDRWDLLAEAQMAALARWSIVPVAVAQNGLVQSPDVDPIGLRPDGSIDTLSLG